ncbi:hypothetical protein F2Q69_00059019 [Brassica cretica]|uniref:Uncharacterized protein n=1 Tax=Brassica cretica TaxID=69181 RepID=A0A8S9RHK5_BRACR|nr:hypothetical protein F2Q69_00059019 [Brassica cretica]
MHTEEYDEDYEEERATQYRAILDEEDKLLHHSSWKRNALSIDRTFSTSIENQPHHTNRKRLSTDIAYYPSIDTGIDRVREGDYSIGSWADDYHHESYAVETEIHEPRADELHEGFTYEELPNMQRRDEVDQHQAETTEERTRFSHFIDRTIRPSIDERPPSSIDIRPKPKPTVSENPNFDNQYLTPDKFGIFQGSRRLCKDNRWTCTADNLFMQQRTVPAHPQRVTTEFYDAAGSKDNRFKQKIRHHTRPPIDVDVPPSINRRLEFGRRALDLFGTRKFYWEEKDEYGVYRDDQRCARDMDGHIINVSKGDIRKLMERGSRDEHNYICLPEHASSFTQTKLVPEIYTKDEINEMFYRVCGAQEKNEVDFQMKLDGVYYPLNDSISWLTTCTEEMRQDIAKIQCAADKHRSPSINIHHPESIDRQHSTSNDDDPKNSHPMKAQPDFHTRAEIVQLVEEIYRTLETTEERIDRRCVDIYFPMDLSISDLTSKIEAIQGELVEIQSYIARRPEASTSIYRRNNRSTDILRQTSVDDSTNRGRIVPKVTSDMSDTHNQGEEILADTYATLRRHQFNLENLGDRLQKMENTTAAMKEK